MPFSYWKLVVGPPTSYWICFQPNFPASFSATPHYLPTEPRRQPTFLSEMLTMPLLLLFSLLESPWKQHANVLYLPLAPHSCLPQTLFVFCFKKTLLDRLSGDFVLHFCLFCMPDLISKRPRTVSFLFFIFFKIQLSDRYILMTQWILLLD